MKRFLAITMAAITVLTATSFGAELKINGETVDTDVEIVDDTSVLSIRKILEGLGYNVEWDGETKTVNAVSENSSNSLKIKEQGMFSAGGTVVTSEGTFDPENHWEETGAGQTAHVDHANVLYQIP